MSRLRSFAAFCLRAALAMVLGSSALESSARADLAPGQVQYNPALSSFSFFAPSYASGPLPAAFNIPVISTNFPYNYNGQKDGSFFGWVTSSIFANAQGQLAFTYVFNNLDPGSGAPLTDIVRATINDPTNPWFNSDPQVNAPFRIFAVGADSSGQSTPVNGFFGSWSNGNPFSVQRDGTDDGVSINFNPLNSGTQLNSVPNDRSALIWLTTDATRADITNVGLSDNGHVGTARAYAPKVNGTIPTPEPSTLVLSAIACLGGGLLVRRKRRTIVSA
jgi:hypothetical protein